MNITPALSFCITCKNRLYQIKNTLRKNLDDNVLHQDFIDFILVDFGSNDGLHDWVSDNFQPELASGYLKYYYTKELTRWHASIAKNTAHLCASGDILVNLDCDNFTGLWGGAFVLRAFRTYGYCLLLHQFSGIVGNGSFGRIAVHRDFFYLLGGYDESFAPMGHQDHDLIKRLTRYGLKYINQPDSSYNRAIPNTKEDGLLYTGSEKTYGEMLDTNHNRSEQNLAEGCLIANDGIFGIRKNLFTHTGRFFAPKCKNK